MTGSPAQSKRIAAIDWMRGFVMILMMLDHVSMAFNGHHFSADSAARFEGVLPDAFAFITRWITHLCAPTFVFLAGTALAISVERKVQKGMDAKIIDRGIITRGLFILLLDPTLVSLFSWRLTFQVLYAIGGAMICMALLRRLSTKLLVAVSLSWIFFGELLVRQLWDPGLGNPAIPTAFTMALYYEPFFRISYPLLPWLSIMCLGWVFGRYLNERKSPGFKGPEPIPVLIGAGTVSLAIFALVRWLSSYGNMMLTPDIPGWMEFLFVSKYPPSLSYTTQQLGLLCLMLAGMIALEKKIGVRPNGVLLVFGQTAMFFYLVHRIVLEGLAQWCGLRGFGSIGITYLISVIFLVLLYPLCRWYRQYKKEHPGGWTSFI
jgi:uncharacterized membrane protein